MDLARREMVRSVIPAGSDDEGEYAFVHALVRDVAYAALPRAARLVRHRAAAAWIAERSTGHLGPHAERVVAHLADARELAAATHAPAVESAAIETALMTSLLAAADHGMRTQPTRAVGHLRRALELVVADDPRRPDVLAHLGRAHLAVLDHAAALPVLEEAAEAYRRRGDSIAAAELAVSLGAAVFNLGDAYRDEAIVDEARRVLEQHPGPGLVAILAEQAHIAIQRDHDSDAIARANGAIDLARKLGIPPPHAALHARGVARLWLDLDGGEADLRLAIERAEAEGDLRAAAGAFINLAGALNGVSGTAAGIRAADETIAFCAAHGMPTGAAKVRRAEVLFVAGAWDEAFTEAEVGRAWGTEHQDAWVVTMAEKVINWVRVDRGERTGPLTGFYSGFLAMGFRSTGAASLVADAALADSGPETALGVLQDAIERSSPGELEEPASFVRACLRAGSPRLAQQALSLGFAQRPAEATGLVSAEAMLAEAEGDLPAARNGFASAAEVFARLGNVPEHAYAVAGLGRCLLALGETEEGIARLLESRAIWERLRATPRIAEIDALLAVAAR
jgi:tetratricopeptide (TPR) repeat protein